MALTLKEVQPGIVAYFDVSVLNGSQTVRKPASPTSRNGPFVCFAVVGDCSAWAPISKEYRSERVEIKKQWRLAGGGAWKKSDQYLNDGSTTYVGPSKAFVEAAAVVDTYNASGRPRVAPDGVAAIIAEVRSRNGNRLE